MWIYAHLDVYVRVYVCIYLYIYKYIQYKYIAYTKHFRSSIELNQLKYITYILKNVRQQH